MLFQGVPKADYMSLSSQQYSSVWDNPYMDGVPPVLLRLPSEYGMDWINPLDS